MTYQTTEWLLARTNEIWDDYHKELTALDTSLREKKIAEDEYALQRQIITDRYLSRITVAVGRLN